MIILNPRLNLQGKRYGSTSITISNAYSTNERIVIFVDHMDRLLTFKGSIPCLLNDFNSVHNNSSKQFPDYFIKKSNTKFKIIFSDLTTLVGNISDLKTQL